MRIRVLIVAVCALLCAPILAQSRASIDRDVIAAHWLPETAATARLYTWAAARVLQSDGDDLSASGWRQRWQAEVDQWADQAVPIALTHQLADGRWGHWVSTQSLNAAPSPAPVDLRWQDMPQKLGGQWWLWQAVVARQVVDIWQGIEPLDAADVFAPVLAAFETASEEAVAHARAQARRIERMDAARSVQTRQLIQGSLILAQAQFEWDQGEHLDSAWLSLEGLMRLVGSNDQQNIGFYADWLGSLAIDQVRALQSIDTQFPVIVALLQDSANHLLASEHDQAHNKLAQAYVDLALVGSGMAAYLDQPVREGLVDLYRRCSSQQATRALPNPAQCIDDIAQALTNDILSEELVGATGPLSATFLRRELDLVSWQRARYLDSYLNWQLDSQCPVPDWFNALEWNLGVHRLALLASQGTPSSDPAIAALMDKNEQLRAGTEQWLDCVAGVGGERTDLVMRLVAQHQQAIDELEAAIEQAHADYASEALVAGSDVALDEPLGRQTDYRNQALTVAPCDQQRSCGARAVLPVSDGLLALVPDAFWLAEQLKMGQVKLCYDNVGWVDRQLSPARHNDSGVANYTGRLSFTLDARFERLETTAVIFSHRLETERRQTYFFGRADEAQLAMDCPHGMDGQPIESELSGNGAGLVPDRLTYFTSVPTSTTAHLLAHWAEGDQWQAQLARGQGVEVDQPADGSAILAEAEQQRIDLVNRRERALATRLSNLDMAQTDPLMQAMRDVETLSRLIRQAMTLHHAPLVRHDEPLRSLLWGDRGLLTRASIRQARDEGILMREVPSLGRQRNAQLEDSWQRWPEDIRQLGFMSPELQRAQALLASLLSAEALRGEPPTDP